MSTPHPILPAVDSSSDAPGPVNLPSVGTPASPPTPAPGPAHPSLANSVMVGYQGWYRTPDDGAQMQWDHYQIGGGQFQPGSASPPQQEMLNIDYWPDVSDLPATSQVNTPFLLADGVTPAPVFSSSDPAVINHHFGLMRQYGIDGAFVQRFAVGFNATAPAQNPGQVLQWELAAAQAAGRSLAVMYDLSGFPGDPTAAVLADWSNLVATLNLTQNPAYQYHRGRPLVGVFGVGFNDGRAYSVADTGSLLPALTDLGLCVLAGVPSGWCQAQNWRTGQRDASNDTDLLAVLAGVDVISPWTPGRFSDLGEAQLWCENYWLPDIQWCRQHGVDYLPVVFPGFSDCNQQAGMALNRTPGTGASRVDRVDGRFLWAQYRLLMNAGCTMFYQAMFDEMDEGTQIFKVAQNPPPGQNLINYPAPLPNDYYLQLVGYAASQVHQTPVPTQPAQLPHVFSDAVNSYLAQNDALAYQAAALSYTGNAALAQYLATLAAWMPGTQPDLAPPWVPVIGSAMPWWAPPPAAGSTPVDQSGACVQLGGQWPVRPVTSTDPTATVTWDLPVPAAATYQLLIRYPNEGQSVLSAARLVVTQGGGALFSSAVNLQVDALQWNEITSVPLAAGRCRVALSNPNPQTPASLKLPFFEAWLMLAAPG
ncbi:MAG: hypothetical protein HZA93_00115 [Verrucomicrobia bacterium]|nr:hypothetical protein [Verrucomicrobiota bacterium]